MELSQIKIAFFDVVGTVVDDSSGGKSVIVRAFIDAFAQYGIIMNPEEVREHRGKQKRLVIEHKLRSMAHIEEPTRKQLTEKIYGDFVNRLKMHSHEFKPIERVTETLRWLKERAIVVGMGSGLPVAVLDDIVGRCGWTDLPLVDYVKSAEAIGKSRPDPAMIHDIMAQYSISDPRAVVKIGDTIVDIQEGKNAGCWTVSVLTGSYSRTDLEPYQPDFIIDSAGTLPSIFLKGVKTA